MDALVERLNLSPTGVLNAFKPVWAVALSFKSRGRKFAGGRAVPVK